ncbi:polymerase gamma [Nannochloropsis oceanica]
MSTAGQPLKRAVLEQLLPVVSNDAGDPRAAASLQEFISAHIPIESEREQRRRRDKVLELRSLFLQWVQDTCRAKNLPEEVVAVAGGEVYIMGSYKLNVHEPGADIDLCCVVPLHVAREEFFTSFLEKLRSHPKVKDLACAASAHVPIMSFALDGVDFDVLFAQLPLTSVKAGMSVDDDLVLRGVDAKTYLSLNGPRTTNMITRLIPTSAQASFLAVLRVVRVWAKNRGLYANKMGYLGGVNFNILVAMICQMYPYANPALMLHRFFLVLGERWKWPTPVRLCKNFDAGLGFTVWEQGGSTRRELMPIITPAYPAGNSAYNVSTQTLGVMKEEFARGKKIMDKCLALASVDPTGAVARAAWLELIEPSDFFLRYNRYLAVDMWASTAEGEAAWFGLVESRLRLLVDILDRELREIYGLGQVFKSVHLFPRAFPPCAGAGAAGRVEGGRGEMHAAQCFYIGLAFDREEMERRKVGKEVFIGEFIRKWRFAVETPPRPQPGHQQLQQPRSQRPKGCDVLVSEVKWRELPACVFDSLGGEKVARARRRRERGKGGKKQKKGKKRARRGDREEEEEEEEVEGGLAVAEGQKEEGRKEGEGEEEDEIEGFTPLHTAAYTGDLITVKILTKEEEGEGEGGREGGRGGLVAVKRVDALDAKGRTPAQVARERGFDEVALYLEGLIEEEGERGGEGGGGGEGNGKVKEKTNNGGPASRLPPVDGNAEYDDADDDVLGAAEAAMEQAMEEEEEEGGEEGKEEVAAGRAAAAAAAEKKRREEEEEEEVEEMKKKKALLMSAHMVMVEAGELNLEPFIPRWRKEAMLVLTGGGRERGRGECLIRTPVVMDLTLDGNKEEGEEKGEERSGKRRGERGGRRK